MALTESKLEGVKAASERARQEQDFWEQHWGEFLTKYPEQFVAVLNGEVVAADSDLLALHRVISTRGIDRHKVWVRFITADPRQMTH
jgi:hypothetical protein